MLRLSFSKRALSVLATCRGFLPGDTTGVETEGCVRNLGFRAVYDGCERGFRFGVEEEGLGLVLTLGPLLADLPRPDDFSVSVMVFYCV